MRFILLFCSSCFAVSCASTNSVKIPADYKSYSDSISVSAALTLAETSYTLGCVEAFKAVDQVSGANAKCQEWSKKNVKANVLRILNQ